MSGNRQHNVWGPPQGSAPLSSSQWPKPGRNASATNTRGGLKSGAQAPSFVPSSSSDAPPVNAPEFVPWGNSLSSTGSSSYASVAHIPEFVPSYATGGGEGGNANVNSSAEAKPMSFGRKMQFGPSRNTVGMVSRSASEPTGSSMGHKTHPADAPTFVPQTGNSHGGRDQGSYHDMEHPEHEAPSDYEVNHLGHDDDWGLSGPLHQQVAAATALGATTDTLESMFGPMPGMTEPHFYTRRPQQSVRCMGLSDEINELMGAYHVAHAMSLPPGHATYKEIPSNFRRVWPLDMTHGVVAGATGSFGYVSNVYKVTSLKDGLSYALRRVDKVRSTQAICGRVKFQWSKVSNANIVKLKDIFQAAGAIFFLHEFWPGALTIKQKTCDIQGDPLPEGQLASFAIQLVGALKDAHNCGLTWRGILPQRILLTQDGRARLAGAGVLDVLESDSEKALDSMQQADIAGLGSSLLDATCRDGYASKHSNPSLAWVQENYSSDWYGFLTACIFDKSLEKAEKFLTRYYMNELNALYTQQDGLVDQLANQWMNSRLLRILVKLGFVNERPEYAGDPAWSETGDRYILKLFRDYVFHQVNEEGKPILDMGHVIESLWRLDLGDPSKIILSSRDQQSLIVASYATLRAALNAANQELQERQSGPSLDELSSFAAMERKRELQRMKALAKQMGYGQYFNAHSQHAFGGQQATGQSAYAMPGQEAHMMGQQQPHNQQCQFVYPQQGPQPQVFSGYQGTPSDSVTPPPPQPQMYGNTGSVTRMASYPQGYSASTLAGGNQHGNSSGLRVQSAPGSFHPEASDFVPGQ